MLKTIVRHLLLVLIAVMTATASRAAETDSKLTKKQAEKQAKIVAATAAAAQVVKAAQDTESDTDDTANAPVLRVALSGLSDAELLKNVEAFLAIYADRDKNIANPPYTRYLVDAGVEQIQQALQPFGYYRAKVEAKLEKGQNEWQVSYSIDKGQPVRVNKREVAIKGDGRKNSDFNELMQNYPLKKGDILNQEKYTDFKNKLVAISTTDGFFDANFTRKEIILSDDLLSADIFLTYDTGTRYQFGEVQIQQDFLDQDVFDRYKNFEDGELYASKSIADLQRDLYNSGYVKVIDVSTQPNHTDKNVPVQLKVTPKKNKKHTFAIGYGTDSGVRGKYNFDWRWVNRRGHKLKANAFVSKEEQETGVEYRIPGQHPASDYYKLFANVERTDSDDKESLLWNLGGAYHDQNGHLEREFGIKWQQEDFTLGNDSGNIGLLTPYINLTYRKRDDPLHIKDGLLVDGYVAAAHENLLSDVSLFQAIAKAKYIKTYNEVNRVTLSGGAGRTWTEDFHQLPSAYRFFTGGDKTIRGYSYDSIGDTDSSGTNVGGNKWYYGSAEYEYFFRDDMAVAAFVDAGDAYSAEVAKLKVGAGVGFHYYSPIGPIKIDVAHGFDEPGDTARLHLSIGPEF